MAKTKKRAQPTTSAIVLARPEIIVIDSRTGRPPKPPEPRRIVIDPTPVQRDSNAGAVAFGAFLGGLVAGVLAPAPSSSLLDSETERMAKAIHAGIYAYVSSWANATEATRDNCRRVARSVRATLNESQCEHCGAQRR